MTKPLPGFWLCVVASILVFFNTAFLPNGFYYSLFLTPFFFIMVYMYGNAVNTFGIAFLVFGLWALIQMAYGIDSNAYSKSSAVLICTFTLAAGIYHWIKEHPELIDGLMVIMTWLNLVLVIVAVATLPVWEDNILWYTNDLTDLIQMRRLRLFTSEASVYSLTLIPFFFWYWNNIKGRIFLWLTIVASLGLSLSYGAIGIIGATIFIIAFIKKQTWLWLGVLCAAGGVALLFMGPLANNGLLVRIANILSGNDGSVNGRSVEAFELALKVMDKKNPWFGIGPGQLKILGYDTWDSFYQWAASNDTMPVSVPSAMADTLVIFGYVGAAVRVIVEIYLYRRTRVRLSSFRMCLFYFMFLYQFVGSNSVLPMEYIIWCLAFSGQFNDPSTLKAV